MPRRSRMPRRRIEMRKLKEVLRLRLTAGLSNRKIALITGIGKTAVSKHVRRARKLGLDWTRIASMSEEAIEALLYPSPEEKKPGGPVTPDWDDRCGEGASPQGRHEAASLGGVPRGSRSPCLQLQPVLRAVCIMERRHRAGHALRARGGREVLCGLRRPDARRGRFRQWRGPPGPGLCGDARREQRVWVPGTHL